MILFMSIQILNLQLSLVKHFFICHENILRYYVLLRDFDKSKIMKQVFSFFLLYVIDRYFI